MEPFRFPYKVPCAAEQRAENRRMLECISRYMHFADADTVTPSAVAELAEVCGVPREYAYAELLAAALGLDTTGADRDFFRAYFLPAVKEYRTGDFLMDPYRAYFPKQEVRAGNYRYRTQRLLPCELFVAGDLQRMKDGRIIPRLGFFSEAYAYPAALAGEREWMTLLPVECITVRPVAEEAFGRVLTYGLGLGYFTLLAAENPRVTRVTAVELDADAVRLFESQILPRLPKDLRGKISLRFGDALAYADGVSAENTDFVFADIWHDAADGRAPYLALRNKERAGVTYRYWIEDTLLCYLDGSLDA